MKMSICEIAYQHYLPEKRSRRRANTVEGYESAFKCHVIPRWGNYTIAEIDRDEVQAWVDSFEKPGAGWKAYKTLRQVIRWAIRKFKMLVIDPTIGVEKPRTTPYFPKVLTVSALEKRVEGFKDYEHEPTVILQSALGLRPGENYALDWRDINMTTGVVRVHKTLQQHRGGMDIYLPKTPKGWRDLILPKWAHERLRELWRALGRPRGRIIGELTPSAISSRIKRYADRHKLPKVTMENTRHTWGTIAVEAGGDIATIAMMMGHSDITTTYRYYLRLNTRAMRRLQRRLNAKMMRR